MPLLISDELLQETGLSEREATIEIACRLFAAGRLVMPAATRWTGLSRGEFEQALLDRGLPLVVADEDYWRQECKTLDARQSP
jgi:predicted HTH domain antitoxin